MKSSEIFLFPRYLRPQFFTVNSKSRQSKFLKCNKTCLIAEHVYSSALFYGILEYWRKITAYCDTIPYKRRNSRCVVVFHSIVHIFFRNSRLGGLMRILKSFWVDFSIFNVNSDFFTDSIRSLLFIYLFFNIFRNIYMWWNTDSMNVITSFFWTCVKIYLYFVQKKNNHQTFQDI